MTVLDTPPIIEQLRSRFGSALRVGQGCDLASDLCVEIDDGGFLTIGDRVSIRRGATIQVHRGGTVAIGNDVAIGENTFLSAMVGIRIGDGVGISNMVDIHDHNHRERSRPHVPDGEPTPWASGFAGAPVIVETGAVLSNKVSVTAGVRIGQNTVVGANSTVTRSLGPNTVAAGAPARPIRTFDGPLATTEDRQTLRIGWFGTSIMEHLEGYNAQMATQANLPAVGSSVTVEAWRNRGYVQRLHLALQVAWPHLGFAFDNHGEGGATSRDILGIVRGTLPPEGRVFDLAFLGCGINDVWRGFQGRAHEAVDADEFDANYREMLRLLTAGARRVICISETPFGWDDTGLDIDAMNNELARYNTLAARAATDAGAQFLDVWPAFTTTAHALAGWSPATRPDQTLWSDGVHLSELGDALLLRLVDQHLHETDLITDLTRYDLYERDEARTIYNHLVADHSRTDVIAPRR
ncbi:hypothetical protein CcI156_18190 [Frankia sp. CcI156]|uniref:GDSL-type esterase/lipase family protein n=1 Tax=Frankia TaxID=1854 RepID=UPI0003D00F4B|nr:MULTISPECIES: GDSL-type esterase/lipase family protein [Frankia]ETA00768.1 acetyltransferase (isoleucine patch superfamily) [Frankia sp. CcI6]KFB03330.1 acetyltransferase (isoleucine patch superfamily) [Frankia sp. Allo2]OAA21320.1 acetyltransferase (isoleucine patch superfamily) [Frankia casuarinae]ONH23589.1 hypothetical protein CcI156_18190 [Frankia sp. CcI156]